jgi:hypothetical protein
MIPATAGITASISAASLWVFAQSVKGLEFGPEAVPGQCPACHNHLFAEQCTIECVEGMPEFQKHIVGDIDNIIDRPYAALLKALLYPCRRFRDGDACDQTPGISVAELHVSNLD